MPGIATAGRKRPQTHKRALHRPAAEWQNTLLDTHQICTHRTRPALEWARSRNHAKSSVIIVFPPPRGYIATMRARGRPNTRGMDRDGHRGFERSMRPRVSHGVRMSGAPRRSRSQHPVPEATTPPALVHRGYPPALCLGLLSRFRFSLPSAEHGEGGRMEAALRDGAAAFCKVTSAFDI